MLWCMMDLALLLSFIDADRQLSRNEKSRVHLRQLNFTMVHEMVHIINLQVKIPVEWYGFQLNGLMNTRRLLGCWLRTASINTDNDRFCLYDKSTELRVRCKQPVFSTHIFCIQLLNWLHHTKLSQLFTKHVERSSICGHFTAVEPVRAAYIAKTITMAGMQVIRV